MKKAICLLITIVIVLASTGTTYAGIWNSSFLGNSGFFEGARGGLTKDSSTEWSAKLSSIGWFGCWGARVYKEINIQKGKKYDIQFNIKSTKFDKYVFLKIGNIDGSKINFAKWINCKCGKVVKVKKTFKAKYDGDNCYFGLGGDFGDKSDAEAKIRYSYAVDKKLDSRLGPSYAADHPTVIECSDFSINESKPRFQCKYLDQGVLIMKKGKVAVLKINGVNGKVKWSIKKKKLGKLKKINRYKVLVKAKKRGTTTIIAKCKKKKYKLKMAIY